MFFFLKGKNTVLPRKEKTSRLAEYGKTVVWMLMSIYSWLAESVKIGGAAPCGTKKSYRLCIGLKIGIII